MSERPEYPPEATPAERKLFRCAARGEVADYSEDTDKTIRAHILRDLLLRAGTRWSVHEWGVRARGALITGVLGLVFAKVHVSIDLKGCTFDRDLIFQDAQLQALFLDGSTVDGAMRGDRLSVDGNVHLREGFSVSGPVRLLGANIGGSLNCSGATFAGRDEIGAAFNADGLKVGGSLFLHGARFTQGGVRLVTSDSGGNLECDGTRFAGSDNAGHSFNLQNAMVGGNLFWRGFEEPPTRSIMFSRARVDTLADDESSWPEDGMGVLALDGFTYNALAPGAPWRAKQRLEWLARMPDDDYRPQPYEHLAKVLREMGHPGEAREIAIAKQRAYIKHLEQDGHSLRAVWHRFLGVTIGHGYRPWRAAVWLLGFLLFGFVIFSQAHTLGVMVPIKDRVFMNPAYEDYGAPITGERYLRHRELPGAYPRFKPFVYSLDVLLPIVDLHQESFWEPRTHERPYGLWYRFYMWIHIAAGWVLSTLAVVGLTGLVKKD